ncbi:LolA family protein [Solwaraspora sp. WMMB335]|uniref:LolA family protein n=1 Tax=Solwaraspora sp. WMMB335 TaxID=3404118 RepID=UPI003B9667AF
MSVFTSRPAMRWLVPGAAAAVLIGGGAALGALAASADPVLPPRSAEQLLVDLQTAQVDGMSGTVVHRTELGLPPAVNLAAQVGGNGLGSLLDGTHTVRVWYAEPDQARIAMVRTLGETDVIRNGRDVWIWSSQQSEASHFELPQDVAEAADRPAPEGLVTPQAAADEVLDAIDESTEVSVGRSAEIAGRTAYELVLTPRAEASLVKEIRIAIDSVEFVPLRFAVYAKGADRAAIEIAFTQVSFERPDAEQFEFNPPPGTTVDEGADSGERQWPGNHDPELWDPEQAGPGGLLEMFEDWPGAADSGAEVVRSAGSGWATVLVVTPPVEVAGHASDGGPAAGAEPADGSGPLLTLGDLPEVSGSWGSGRLFSSALLTVLLTDDGRILAGAVAPERLYEVAAQTR